MAHKNYYQQKSILTQHKLKSIMNKLPDFCRRFFIGIEHRTQPGTRLHYSYDLLIFFRYIKTIKKEYQDIEICDLPIKLLDDITSFEIEQYLSYLICYTDEHGNIHTNSAAGIKNKLAALRSLYNYCFKRELIVKNTSQLVDIPQIHDKNIIRLNEKQVLQLLDNVENGTLLTPRQQKWHTRFKIRDYAIIMLLLGTGMRVSECVGIDIEDIDFTECSISITRKGGNQDKLYFSDEVRAALKEYYTERLIIDAEDNSRAFFLSLNRTRLAVRSIQILVHKYSKGIKEITPHKLRSTYGTNLYVATKDIYLVATVLGHNNVNTTKKHYAAIPDTEKRNVRNAIIIKKEEDQ